MENIDFDWLDANSAIDYGTPELLTSDSPRASSVAEHANPIAERPDSIEQTEQPRSDRVLHLLRLAPSDFWKTDFEPRIAILPKDEDKLPADSYTCEEAIVEIFVERSRQRGLKKRIKGLEIDWNVLDSHVEGLGDLFGGKGRKIKFGVELIYKEATGNVVATAKSKKKGQSATEARKLQRTADTGLWARVYKHHRCRGKHCKLEEYCSWNLQQVKSDKWREALQAANQFAADQFLELNSILKHLKVAADLMVKGGVKPGIAL
ncbi:hypothetical protein CMUS01_16343 [Colletotrichum musicola]|uniref:Uncharacterized protein n=1 Tax=Colletotrichum musicola TaxID=2175873 RepID=A0A8H6IPP7_9PEZI|nr:hypothetical protein CMUS01_16343 [Colletotrichum musicola]